MDDAKLALPPASVEEHLHLLDNYALAEEDGYRSNQLKYHNLLAKEEKQNQHISTVKRQIALRLEAQDAFVARTYALDGHKTVDEAEKQCADFERAVTDKCDSIDVKLLAMPATVEGILEDHKKRRRKLGQQIEPAQMKAATVMSEIAMVEKRKRDVAALNQNQQHLSHYLPELGDTVIDHLVRQLDDGVVGEHDPIVIDEMVERALESMIASR